MLGQKNVADLLEQVEPQAMNHNPSIPDNPNRVKLKFGDLATLRTGKGLLAKDMVEVVQAIYPKYDKMLHSKCEHGNDYGIELRQDAMTALYARFAPEVIRQMKRKRVTDTFRIQARLSEMVYKLFREALKADGYSVQGWIEKQVFDYLDRRQRNV